MTKKICFAALLILALCALGWTQATKPARAEWEYKVMPIPQFGTPPELQQAGAEGWELVAVERYESGGGGKPVTAYYLKRQK